MVFKPRNTLGVGGNKPTPQDNTRTEEDQARCDSAHAEVATYGRKVIGGGDYRNYLAGKRLTLAQSIRARCYECNGFGEQMSCTGVTCALYPFFLATTGESIDSDDAATSKGE